MRWLILIWLLFLGVPLEAEQLPEMRPALMGTGPRSLVNMINTERLMKRGQKDAMVMFTCAVAPVGWAYDMVMYRGTQDSEALAEEALNAVSNVRFIPAIYAGERRWASVSGTILYRVIQGRPHLRIYMNEESERILHGEDFIAPQPVFIPDKDLDVRRWYRYPAQGFSANVVIRLSLDVNGKFRDAKLVFETPPGKGFGARWLSDIRNWTFVPGYQNGKSVACSANIEIISRTAGKRWDRWQPD